MMNIDARINYIPSKTIEEPDLAILATLSKLPNGYNLTITNAVGTFTQFFQAIQLELFLNVLNKKLDELKELK